MPPKPNADTALILKTLRDRDLGQDGFISTPNAARLARCSVSNIYRLIDSEAGAPKVKSTRVGGTIFVDLESLRDHLGKDACNRWRLPTKADLIKLAKEA